jgi:hypothetical protein
VLLCWWVSALNTSPHSEVSVPHALCHQGHPLDAPLGAASSFAANGTSAPPRSLLCRFAAVTLNLNEARYPTGAGCGLWGGRGSQGQQRPRQEQHDVPTPRPQRRRQRAQREPPKPMRLDSCNK